VCFLLLAPHICARVLSSICVLLASTVWAQVIVRCIWVWRRQKINITLYAYLFALTLNEDHHYREKLPSVWPRPEHIHQWQLSYVAACFLLSFDLRQFSTQIFLWDKEVSGDGCIWATMQIRGSFQWAQTSVKLVWSLESSDICRFSTNRNSQCCVSYHLALMLLPEVAVVIFSDPGSTPVPKFLNSDPGPTFFKFGNPTPVQTPATIDASEI